MTTITLDLPLDVYRRLNDEANPTGKPIEAVAGELLAGQLTTAPLSERDRATEVLRAAGLLVEPGPEMKARAARSTATLEEVQAALAKGTGKTLSEIVIEQRGPKRLDETEVLGDPLLGMFAVDPELLDQVVESAMQAREEHSLRPIDG